MIDREKSSSLTAATHGNPKAQTEFEFWKRRQSMKIESIAENSLLFDFYGQLLSKRQQEVMALYHEENLSLSEIADEFGISRQAVHDTLKKAELALGEYERKLGLVGKLAASKKAINDIDKKIDCMTERISDAEIVSELKEIKQIINTLEE